MNAPLFKIMPLLNNFYLEQIGNIEISAKENDSINKSIETLSKSIKDPLRWIYVRYEDNDYPVLLKKSGEYDLMIRGPKPLEMKKAKTEKDLEYWKKKLSEILTMEKSLEDILYEGITKSLPIYSKQLLLKARGYAPGTIREWKGKKYKKMTSGKWVRTYDEAESRGAKQAIRNVKKKILDAKSMAELLEIVKENKSRFADKDGKALPVIKEFLEAARATEAGEKRTSEDKSDISGAKEIKEEIFERKRQYKDGSFDLTEDEAEELIDAMKKKNPDIDFYTTGEDGDLFIYAELKGEDVTDNVIINPYDVLEGISEELSDLNTTETKDVKPETPKVDYEEQEKKQDERVDIEPDTPPATGEEAQKSIEEANPSNRQQKTLEIAGTLKEAKTEDEVLKEQNVDSVGVKIFSMKRTITKIKSSAQSETYQGVIKGKDYTDIDQRKVLLVSYKDIKKAGDNWEDVKPDWMPEINYDNFSSSSMMNTLIYAPLDEDKYIVPIDQKYRGHMGSMYIPGTGGGAKFDSFKQEYAIMTLSQISATQDFYRKVSKSLNDKAYQEKVAYYKEKGYLGKVKKTRIKVMPSNKTTYDQMYLMSDMAGISRRDMWKNLEENTRKFKQKTIDMDLMKEEVDNSFSKGRETAYGDSNTSDALKSEMGIKIKMQDGSDVKPEDQAYLKSAMESVQRTFGDRKSMNENFGLKLSFAKGTAMHAKKAVGLFVPSQKAIGISDGKGLKKKNPLTGEMMTVDYGDENFGGFVLSHEYAHMMDYYLGSKTGQWYASDDITKTAGKIADTFRSNMNKKSDSDYINRTCECFARALEQYHAMETSGENAMSFASPYVKTEQYVNAGTFNREVKPLIEQFFKENDTLLKSITVII